MKNQISMIIVGILLLMISCQPTPTTEDKKEDNLSTNKTKLYEFEKFNPPTLEALQKDANVLWIGETVMTYAPQYHKYNITKKQKELLKQAGMPSINRVKTLKLQLQDLDESNWEAYYLNDKIIRNIDKIDCYRDAALTQKYTEQEVKEIISTIDTIVTFDPETFKETLQAINNTIHPGDIYTFEMKQFIYYDKKAVTFKVIPSAIAPVFPTFNNKGEVVETKPLFWIPIQQLAKTPDLNVAAITYAKRIYSQAKEDNIKTLKGDMSIGELIVEMMNAAKVNPTTVYLGNVYSSDGVEQLTESEIKLIAEKSIDTIITFDPVTFKEDVQVVENELEPNDFKKLRLIQDWVWNEDRKSLGINFVGFAPIIDRVDEKGNFLNSGPMFVRRPDKDK